MPQFRNTDYKPHQWREVEKPLSTEGFLLFILSDIGNTEDFRSNILGAISTLMNVEQWNGDSEISSAYAALEIFLADFCEKVRDCILNNQATKDAILATILESGYYPSETPIPFNTGSNIENIIEGLTCSENDLKGYAKTIIEYVHAVSLDALQVFASETQQSMFMARMLDYFPLIGDLPIIDDISDIATWIEDVLIVQYEAGYTEALRDEIICAIYAQCCYDCNLTVQDIINAYASLGGYAIPSGSDLMAIVDLLKGTMSDTLVVLLFHSLVIGAMGSGSKVLGYVGVKGLQQVLANSEPFALATCDECEIPNSIIVTFDAGGYPVYTVESGTIQSGTGNPDNALRSSKTCSFCSNQAILNIQLLEPRNVTSVSLDAYNRSAINEVYVRLYDASDTLLGSYGGNVTGVTGGGWLNNAFFMDVDNVSRVQIECANGSGAVSTFLDNRIDNVVVGYVV